MQMPKARRTSRVLPVQYIAVSCRRAMPYFLCYCCIQLRISSCFLLCLQSDLCSAPCFPIRTRPRSYVKMYPGITANKRKPLKNQGFQERVQSPAKERVMGIEPDPITSKNGLNTAFFIFYDKFHDKKYSLTIITPHFRTHLHIILAVYRKAIFSMSHYYFSSRNQLSFHF